MTLSDSYREDLTKFFEGEVPEDIHLAYKRVRTLSMAKRWTNKSPGKDKDIDEDKSGKHSTPSYTPNKSTMRELNNDVETLKAKLLDTANRAGDKIERIFRNYTIEEDMIWWTGSGKSRIYIYPQ